MTLLAVAAAVLLLSLDQVHLFQFNISRPLCVGPIVGYLIGDLRTGLWIGAWIELVWITIIPVGHYAQPETVIATAVSVLAAAAFRPAGEAATLSHAVLGLAYGIPWGILSRRFDLLQRRMVARKAEKWMLRLAECASPPPLGPFLVASILLKGAWALGLTAVAAGAATLLPDIPLRPGVVRGLELAATWLPLLGAASLARVLDFERRPFAFVAGIILGACLGYLG